MTGWLIGKRSGAVIEVWHGSDQELRERFEYEGGDCYILDIYDGDPSSDGSLVCELSH